ncbi:DUF4433 domain-containing protein [Gilliamella sp. Pas-s95]|uniref:type II toxin-antitoxin system toxin DNA ADP-ribosyl transferase DarT n=1 Tax=Gilliamella sp. Pas-s95 TaxID=2687317 RepID=UPI00132A3170|nr:DUF4433 domain-containing protein [Gilliamella sp. Pas-s95]MWN05357.1 DUF4433 domain-containing protein [Gilliamella sp. Pas-s95]
MAFDYSATLNPKKALIWRIVHINNIPWILDNGLHCGKSNIRCEDWVSIGSTELIDKRSSHPVPVFPHGYLNDYVPFYFTPFSPMLLNIKSGRGVKQRNNDEVVILVSSLHRIQELQLKYVFTDMHAYYKWASFYSAIEDLDRIDWEILQSRDFSRDEDDTAKFERYQAEALIHQHCPINALVGMICYNEQAEEDLNTWLQQRQLKIPVHKRPRWYF